ncbi:hypothetical protein [Streptomyces iconiensis]|uniref:Uncharacterized protein n=1 Tax=Streptomyces iconiensis TaxID=1384038 RepID=A0ABT7A7D9_9ACTN|nr:hypothetical protein [Streptomyces iconiensis]MDJ1136543.1 hypothetical protein [Streptomyces iconiensis]
MSTPAAPAPTTPTTPPVVPLTRVEAELPAGDTPADHRRLTAEVTATLEEAFAALPERVRATATLYVLAGDYSTLAVRRFTRRCHDSERRLRPSDSLALETSELIRPFTTASGHRGSCYVLDRWTSHGPLQDAGPCVPGGTAAVVCELTGDEGGLRAVATAWTRADGADEADRSGADRSGGRGGDGGRGDG